MPDLLAKLGHSPVQEKKNGNEFWYRSPFREEKEPSFHASIGRSGFWIWKDFGDQGGTVIDFVMRYQGYTSIKDALAFLNDLYRPSLFSTQPAKVPQKAPAPDLFSFHQQSHRAAVENFLESELEFLSAIPIKNPVILSYLSEERCIPPAIAKRYLQEVRYKHTPSGKEYFGFGMANQAGGWEIRPASSRYTFKAPLIARDISVIPGTSAERNTAHIFEGMTDFLSYLVLTGTEQIPDDAIVMHSLSSYSRAAAHIRSQDYQQLRTYLDNDKAGQQGTERFKADFGAKVLPQGERFATHKDLNLYLQAKREKPGNTRG